VLSVGVIIPGGAPSVLFDGGGFAVGMIGPNPLRPRELEPAKLEGGPTGPGPPAD
jgi:hypothetical protein